MIKFSKMADYAVVILAVLSKSDGALMSSASISATTNLPEPTVAKVAKLLAKANIVQSIRGANGGYQMAKTESELSVAQIVTAVDGPVALTACVEHGTHDCSFTSLCPSKGRWDHVNAAVQQTLETIKLSDMIRADYTPHNKTRKQEGLVA